MVKKRHKSPYTKNLRDKQAAALGLPVFTRARWSHLIVEKEKVFFVYSVSSKMPKIENLYGIKHEIYGQSADFLIAMQIDGKNNANILRAIVHIRWKKVTEEQVKFLAEELNRAENSNSIWEFYENKKTISGMYQSKLTPVDLVERIKNILII